VIRAELPANRGNSQNRPEVETVRARRDFIGSGGPAPRGMSHIVAPQRFITSVLADKQHVALTAPRRVRAALAAGVDRRQDRVTTRPVRFACQGAPWRYSPYDECSPGHALAIPVANPHPASDAQAPRVKR
jgi:hypothetical protein